MAVCMSFSTRILRALNDLLEPTVKLLPYLAVAAILAQALPSAAQEPAETKIVLRVSREFLNKLAGARFEKDQAIDSNTDGTPVFGTATHRGGGRCQAAQKRNRGLFRSVCSRQHRDTVGGVTTPSGGIRP